MSLMKCGKTISPDIMSNPGVPSPGDLLLCRNEIPSLARRVSRQEDVGIGKFVPDNILVSQKDIGLDRRRAETLSLLSSESTITSDYSVMSMTKNLQFGNLVKSWTIFASEAAA